MSAFPPHEPFSVAEKVELLVNVLQSLVPDLPMYLFKCVVSEQRSERDPEWADMAFPKGRSLNSCKHVFNEMRRTFSVQSGSARPYAPYVTIAPNLASTRSVSAQDPYSTSQRHMPHLQPRPSGTESPIPPVTNGESPSFIRGPLLEPISAHPTSKKRGRPSKEAVAERTAKLAAQGKTYEPKKRPVKRPRPSVGPDASEAKSEAASTPQLQTPIMYATEPVEPTSSGRRRPRRQERDDLPTIETSAGAGMAGMRLEHEQEQESVLSVAGSPSDRLFPGLRDRGSVASSSLSRRTQQESDTLEQGQTELDFAT